MKFNFTIKDNNERDYRLFIWFLFFLHIIAAGIFSFNAVEHKVKLSLYILLGFYAVISMVYYFFRKNSKALETFSLILALLYANFWFQHVGMIAMIIFAIVFLMVAVVKGKKTTVLIADEGVRMTRVFKTIIFPWAEMDNVILKDNLLTIDLRSNKLIQVEVAENAVAVDEESFNGFCFDQIKNNTGS